VALSRLTPHDSVRVVQALLPTPQISAVLLHEIVTKADGNPFFLKALTRSVAEHGTPQPPLALPDTVYALLMARMDHLMPVAKRVLQTAAVIGQEVPFSLLAAITDLSRETLSESLAQLQAAELLQETCLVPESVYTFKHVLIQETAYHALLESSRRQHHLQIAQILAERLATTAAQQPAWLAHHYTEAGDAEHAIPYWQQAGHRAVDRSAHAEAIAHFTHALALLRTLPVTPARARHELTLQCSLGVQLAMREAATPEVERTYARALELCQQVGRAQELFPVLYGLSRLYKKRGKLQRARALGEQLLVLAQHHGDAALLLRSHYVLGDTLLWLGEFPTARAHLEHGLTVYDPQQHDPHDLLLYGADPWLSCLGALSVTLWCLGYPDQAIQRSTEALAQAQVLAHPYSLARVLADAAYLDWFCREWSRLQERTEALRALAATHGFAELYARATYHAALARGKQGQVAEGLAQFHESLDTLQGMQSGDAQALRLAQLAELYRSMGQPDTGLHALAATAADTEERLDAAGRYCLKGELLLRLPCPDTHQAEGCFQHALALARCQQAKSLELRAAISLSRLWQEQGRRDEAHRLLAPLYGWFTEGFDTADLQDAKALLEELGG
jgi:predicted ATPase